MNIEKLKSFANTLSGHENDYVIIGGQACALHFAANEADFRLTEDVDVVLLLENWSEEFNAKLKDFLNANGYTSSSNVIQEGQINTIAYRFDISASNSDLYQIPQQIELFSMKAIPELSTNKSHITAMPKFENVSQLAAIITNEACYNFIVNSKITIKNIPTVSIECLIALKSFAYIDNRQLLARGELGNNRLYDSYKHAEDICRLLILLDQTVTTLPQNLSESIRSTIELFEDKTEQDKLAQFTQTLSIKPESAAQLLKVFL